MEPERRAYLIANSPEWILLVIAMWFAVRDFGVSWSMAASVLTLWVIKDLLLYPVMRRYYRATPAQQRMIGASGVALNPLAPRGFVRVRGEIWQAQIRDGTAPVAEGTKVRVRGIRGMLLFVEPG
jgi:membrane protein implicated in regulation of membrane protease activity